MKASENIITFIAEQEGFRSKAYRPLPTDRWTVGYGFTFLNGAAVKEGDTLSEGQARIVLNGLVQRVAASISPNMPLGVSQNQFDAVVSLVYNIGITAFKNNNIGKMFYNGLDISEKFPLYNSSGGRVIQGLINRRAKEKEIYENGIYN